MRPSERAKKLWVISELGGQMIGINCNEVKEMLVVPNVSKVPGMPEYIRGVINLRGKVLPLVDLRVRFGMRSTREQVDALCSLLEQRANDHKAWLEELKSSVRENRAFLLATDPHQCAFGQWYDNFKTDNVLVSSFLKRFEEPHKKVHALALQVKDLVAGNDMEQALQVIDDAEHHEFAAMMQLFAQLQQTLRDTNREIAVVVDGHEGNFAVCVDSIVAVEQFAENNITGLQDKGIQQQEALTNRVAQRSKGNELVLLLDNDAILNSEVLSELMQA